MEIIDNNLIEELENIIQSVLSKHDDFNYYEIEEICQDFLDEQPKKIKEATKLKRLKKYIIKEFELEDCGRDVSMKHLIHMIHTDSQWGVSSKHLVHTTQMDSQWDVSSKHLYNLETIPKYLFEWKSKIASNLIHIKNLTANIWLTELFEWANLKINKTDKVALIWKNGCGKTTLLKLIIWKKIPQLEWDINIQLAPDVKIWYLSQDLFWQDENNTLYQEMMQIFPKITEKVERLDRLKEDISLFQRESPQGEGLEHKYTKEITELNQSLAEEEWFQKYELQKDILKYFWFSEEQMQQNVLSLSGWEQTKVQIAKFLIQEVDLLILDEPTNHLDIEGIIFLEKFCQNWKKAIISISHDVRFIDNSSERIVEIGQKKIINYTGKYSDFLNQKQAQYDKELKDYNDQKKELKITQDYIDRFRANSAKASSVQSRIKAMAKIEILTEPINEKEVRFISLESTKRLPEIIMKLRNIQAGYSFPLITLPEEIDVHKSDKIWIIWANWTGKTTLLRTILWDLKALEWEATINETIKIWSFAQILEELDLENSVIWELWKTHNNEQEIRKILWGLLIKWDKVNQRISSLSGWERAKVWLTKMLLEKPDIIVMDEPTNHLDLHSKEVIKKMLDWFNGTTLIVSHDRDLLENVSNKIWLIRNKELEIFDEVEEGIREVY